MEGAETWSCRVSLVVIVAPALSSSAPAGESCCSSPRLMPVAELSPRVPERVEGCALIWTFRNSSGVNGNPVDRVLAPVNPVLRFSIFGSPCAFRPVGARRHGDQVLGIIEVVRVTFLSLGRPSPGTAVGGVTERHHVVDVEFAGVGDDGGRRVRSKPFDGGDAASPGGFERYGSTACGNQRSIAGVLAVVVGPVFPIVAVVLQQVCRDLRDGEPQDTQFRRVDCLSPNPPMRVVGALERDMTGMETGSASLISGGWRR